jgi:hypothetical protein
VVEVAVPVAAVAVLAAAVVLAVAVEPSSSPRRVDTTAGVRASSLVVEVAFAPRAPRP